MPPSSRCERAVIRYSTGHDNRRLTIREVGLYALHEANPMGTRGRARGRLVVEARYVGPVFRKLQMERDHKVEIIPLLGIRGSLGNNYCLESISDFPIPASGVSKGRYDCETY